MTFKELLEKRNDKTQSDNLRIGLASLEYHLSELEDEKCINKEYHSYIIHGILLGLQMTDFISEDQFKYLDYERKKTQYNKK